MRLGGRCGGGWKRKPGAEKKLEEEVSLGGGLWGRIAVGLAPVSAVQPAPNKMVQLRGGTFFCLLFFCIPLASDYFPRGVDGAWLHAPMALRLQFEQSGRAICLLVSTALE